MHPLLGLSRTSLVNLARAFSAGTAAWPPSPVQIGRLGLETSPDDVCRELTAAGGSAASAAFFLTLLAEERGVAHGVRERTELVWSGPERSASRTRETSVVVRELFQRAERSVLVATYAIAQGEQVFEALARRMDARPDLQVRICVNLPRPHLDARPEAEILTEHARRLRDLWPWPRRPEICYDPRALALGTGGRASLHAKCVVVDHRWAFVTSANFTEAAQQRNIEAGVIADDPDLARSLAAQFDSLIGGGVLRRLNL